MRLLGPPWVGNAGDAVRLVCAGTDQSRSIGKQSAVPWRVAEDALKVSKSVRSAFFPVVVGDIGKELRPGHQL